MDFEEKSLSPEEFIQRTLYPYGKPSPGDTRYGELGAESTLRALQKSAPLRTAEETEEMKKAIERIEQRQAEKDAQDAKEKFHSRLYDFVALAVAIASMIISLAK